MRESLRALKEQAGAWWLSLTDDQRHFCTNVGIGFAILALVEILSVAGMLSGLKRALLDWQIAQLSGVSTGAYGDPSRADIAFVDIDEPTEEAFADASGGNRPYFTPRDKLKSLIAAAVNGGAAVVVVDIDLSQPPDGDPLGEAYREVTGRPASAANAETLRKLDLRRAHLDAVQQFYFADWQLSDYLADYTRACARKPWPPAAGSCVPIVLARSVAVSTADPEAPPIRRPLHPFSIRPSRTRTAYFGPRSPSTTTATSSSGAGAYTNRCVTRRASAACCRRARCWRTASESR